MSERRNPAWAGLRAALIALSGLALAITGFPAPAQAVDSGAISGAVYLPDGQRAGTNAEVCLFAEPSGGWESQCVQADPYGRFSFSGLDAGDYSLSASADGYVTAYFGGSPYLSQRVVFTLAGGQQLRGKDLRLRTGALITGRVVDSAGKPFSFDLTMRLSGPAEDPRPGEELRPGTAVDGTVPYTFGPVPDGTYRVIAESTVTCTPQQIDRCQWKDATVVVSGGRAVTGPTLRLTGGTGFTGSVSFPGAAGPDRAPSRLYQLDVYNRAGDVVRSGVYEAATPKRTALTGRYELHLAPGRYQLRFTPVDGTASYCLGCAGGLDTRLGQLRDLGTITLAGRVRALSTGGVRIDGSATVGQRLTAVTKGWPTGARLSYQWLRNGHKIKGATSASRVLSAGDRNARISVRVQARLDRVRSVQVTATLGTRVAPGELSAGRVLVSGTPAVGDRLVAASAGWPPAAKLSYRWLRDGAPIRGATAKTYRLQRADRGHRISVEVSASKAGYRSVRVRSALSDGIS